MKKLGRRPFGSSYAGSRLLAFQQKTGLFDNFVDYFPVKIIHGHPRIHD